MIVRINQIDVSSSEQAAGWESHGPRGAIGYHWPHGTHAFELLILEQDEQNQPLARSFRQTQLRQLIPEVLEAMREEGERVVVRLDGPLREGEMIDVYRHLCDATGRGKFAFGGAAKLNAAPSEVLATIRIQPMPALLAALCGDPGVGLDRSVRLRAFVVPDELVDPLLDVNDTDDERWDEILGKAACVMGNVRGMPSLQLITPRYDPNEARTRLTQRLVAGAAGKK